LLWFAGFKSSEKGGVTKEENESNDEEEGILLNLLGESCCLHTAPPSDGFIFCERVGMELPVTSWIIGVLTALKKIFN
jgi:hypothetical protein